MRKRRQSSSGDRASRGITHALVEDVAADDVPIYAPQGVIDTITADDAVKDQIVGPLFGEDWPTDRLFPNTAIADGESVSFDEVKLTVIDLGPSESPHDRPWILGDDAKAVVLGRMKAYEPSDELQILMELSIEPIATKLGLLAPAD